MEHHTFSIILITLYLVYLVGSEAFTYQRSQGDDHDGYANYSNHHEKGNSEVFEKGEHVDITCPDKHVIVIKDSDYGSKEIKCRDPNALQKVRHVCDSEKSCTFLVNDIFFNETDCSGEVDENLEVEYECFPTISDFEEDGTGGVQFDIRFHGNSDVFEKGEQVEITCSDKHIIVIKDADYGGKEIKCGDPNALKKVQHVCDSEKNCTFLVNDIFFNETDCSGEVDEKLEVEYECLPDMSDPIMIEEESDIGGVKDDSSNSEEESDIGGVRDDFSNSEEESDIGGVKDDFSNSGEESDIGGVKDDFSNPEESDIGGERDDSRNSEEESDIVEVNDNSEDNICNGDECPDL